VAKFGKVEMKAPVRRPRWGFAALGGLAVVLAVVGIAGAKKPRKTEHAAPTPVTTATAEVRDMPIWIGNIGAAQAWRSVLIRTQVNGKLLRVGFDEGGEVKTGQVIAEIDPAPYQAQLLQAQGALARDTALLQAAKVDLARYQTLRAQDSVAQQTLDTQAALVKQDEGLVMLDQGQVKAARVNVDYCRITSPVNGRAGVRLVDPGNLVSTTDTTGIVSINVIDPIAVIFTVPEGDFQRLVEASDHFRRPMAAQAFSQETGALLGAGELNIADNHVDSASGTVQLKARFRNAAGRLWPGQFLNVRLTLQTLARAVTIPSAALNQSPKGSFVYVVGADRKVTAQPVAVAATQDGLAIVRSGLSGGETVVTDGQMSLDTGMKVAPRPAAQSRS
jgi:membrane fusion protein, multidrug efflux system